MYERFQYKRILEHISLLDCVATQYVYNKVTHCDDIITILCNYLKLRHNKQPKPFNLSIMISSYENLSSKASLLYIYIYNI